MSSRLTSTNTKTKQPVYWLGLDNAKAKLVYSLINTQGIEQIYGTVANNVVGIIELLLTVSGGLFRIMCKLSRDLYECRRAISSLVISLRFLMY
jgi:hypothetical protein